MSRSTASRTITIGTTNASAAITGATGTFDKSDVGRKITGTGIPANATISAVASSTAATLSANATATNASVAATIAADTLSSSVLGFEGVSVESQDEANSYTVAAAIAGTVAPDRVTGPDQQSPIFASRRGRF